MATIDLRVSIDSRQVRRAFDTLGKQLPFAASLAANDLAFQVQRAERANMASLFDHPRPFTANSAIVAKATKAAPIATVYIRPEVARYLRPYEDGGLHVLPGQGTSLLEPKRIGVDQYGQLRKGTAARLRARPNVFVGPVQTKAGEVYGFWQRLKAKSGPRLKLLIRFGENREVTKRLGFESRAAFVVAQNASAAVVRAVNRVLPGTFG